MTTTQAKILTTTSRGTTELPRRTQICHPQTPALRNNRDTVYCFNPPSLRVSSYSNRYPVYFLRPIFFICKLKVIIKMVCSQRKVEEALSPVRPTSISTFPPSPRGYDNLQDWINSECSEVWCLWPSHLKYTSNLLLVHLRTHYSGNEAGSELCCNVFPALLCDESCGP